MRRILWGLAALVIVGLGLAFVAPLLISTDELRDKALQQIEAATGYRIRVDGPVTITFFPSLDLVASDVGIAQPAAGGPAEFATASSLRLGLKLESLLAGKVRLTELTLLDPVVTLPLPKDSDAGTPEGEGSSLSSQDLSLDALTVHNGTVILPGKNGEPGKQITGLDLAASLPFANGPLSFEASGTYDGDPVKASGSIGSFGYFVQGGPAPAHLTIEAPDYLPDRATLAATAQYKDDVLTLTEARAEAGEDNFTGNASYADDTLTLSQFKATYQGAEVTGDATYKGGAATLTNFTAKYRGFDLAGSGTYNDDVLTLDPISGTFDGHTASGAVTANLAGEVPSVGATLKAEALDLNKLLGRPEGGADAGGKSGWSDEQIDFSPLHKVNADLKLDVGQVTYDKIKIGAASLSAKLQGGKLAAEIPNLKLYGGGGSASVVIDASGKVPAQRVKLTLANLAARPFLSDAVDFDSIDGKGAIDLDLSAAGASERAMVSTLNGTAKFAFTEGAINGLNVANMLRNLTTGVLTGWQFKEDAKTPFNSLGASFKIAQGQAQTDDLRLKGPLVSAGGAGTVDLPGRTLKFRVNPFMLASVEGGGGGNSMLGFPVPIAISGPWDSPSFYPDIVGILDNPVAAYKELNKLGGGLISMPANMLGLDTGEGGLVEKSIALPGAVTKGVVGGVGQMLGITKKDQAAPQAGTAPSQAQSTAADTPAAKSGTQQPAAQAAPPPEAAPQEKKSGPGQLFDGLFGN